MLNLSWVNWSNVEWKNLPTVLTPQHRIQTLGSHSRDCEHCHWANALNKCPMYVWSCHDVYSTCLIVSINVLRMSSDNVHQQLLHYNFCLFQDSDFEYMRACWCHKCQHWSGQASCSRSLTTTRDKFCFCHRFGDNDIRHRVKWHIVINFVTSTPVAGTPSECVIKSPVMDSPCKSDINSSVVGTPFECAINTPVVATAFECDIIFPFEYYGNSP